MAGDGPNGLWMATESPYGAVVLDVMLPGYDGFELCRRLREAGSGTPVLMLTARDEVGDRVRGALDVGADDYLVKPFSLLELAARLRAISRRDDRPRPSVLAAGDLRLDPASKRAWRRDTELQLSPKEFSLLELFLRHPGAVLTRSQIIDAVWDFAYDGTSNVVDQYVKYLRDKIDVCLSVATTSRPSEAWATACATRPTTSRCRSALRLAVVFAVASAPCRARRLAVRRPFSPRRSWRRSTRSWRLRPPKPLSTCRHATTSRPPPRRPIPLSTPSNSSTTPVESGRQSGGRQSSDPLQRRDSTGRDAARSW